MNPSLAENNFRRNLVPILCRPEEYNNLGSDFAIYPYDKGWATETNQFQWLDCSPQELARRAQLWLYFGTLFHYLDENLPATLISRQDLTNGIDILWPQTPALLALLDSKKHDYIITPFSSTTQRSRFDQTAQLLVTVAQFSEILEQRATSLFEQNLVTPDSPLVLISCSIRVLLQTLGDVRDYVFPVPRWHWKTNGTWLPKSDWIVSSSLAVRLKMIQAGWCPAEVHLLSQKHSVTTLYYLSSLLPKPRSGKNHIRCNDLQCSAYSIDMNRYTRQHTLECESCDQTGVAPESVASIINVEHGIPIISLTMTAAGKPVISVRKAAPSERYIALSHVWADGLGNPNGNSIHECQAIKISRLIRGLLQTLEELTLFGKLSRHDEPILFWLDTICIPRGNTPELESARWTTIENIAKVFSSAYATLVLERELTSTCRSRLSQEETLARVMCCSWMSRCWTLQERSLSRSCYVQFSDARVDLQKLCFPELLPLDLFYYLPFVRNKYTGASQKIKAALRRDLTSFLLEMNDVSWERRARAEMWEHDFLQFLQAQSFAATWNNFSGRATSRPENMHIIMARMQDYKASDLRHMQIDQRMKAIIKGHSMLPIDILYHRGSRQGDANSLNQWFSGFPKGSLLDIASGYMEVYLDRLVISDISQNHTVLCKLHSKVSLGELETFGVEFSVETDGQKHNCWVQATSNAKEDSKSHPFPEADCIMFSDHYGYKKLTHQKFRGALFAITEHTQYEIHLTYIKSVTIYPFDVARARNTNHDSGRTLNPKITATRLKIPEMKVFINCDLNDWPTDRHIFENGDQIGQHFSSVVYYMMWISALIFWPIIFVATMIAAPKLQISRLALGIAYLGKNVAIIIEGFWWQSIEREIQRQMWNEDFGQDGAPSFHQIMANYPSIFFGKRRMIFFLSLGTMLTITGSLFSKSRWSLVIGPTILFEWFLRILLHLVWCHLPRSSAGQRMIPKLKDHWRQLREWGLEKAIGSKLKTLRWGVHRDFERTTYGDRNRKLRQETGN